MKFNFLSENLSFSHQERESLQRRFIGIQIVITRFLDREDSL